MKVRIDFDVARNGFVNNTRIRVDPFEANTSPESLLVEALETIDGIVIASGPTTSSTGLLEVEDAFMRVQATAHNALAKHRAALGESG